MTLTDTQVERIVVLLQTPRGTLRIPARQVPDAWFYIAKQDCAWHTQAAAYDNWRTIYMRLNRWAMAGVLDRVVTELHRNQLAALELDALSLDSTIIRLHALVAGERTPVLIFFSLSHLALISDALELL